MKRDGEAEIGEGRADKVEAVWEEWREITGEKQRTERWKREEWASVGGVGKSWAASVKNKGEKTANVEMEVLSESKEYGLGEERAMCFVCTPDESQRDKEINCQEKPVNPERQRGERVCI